MDNELSLGFDDSCYLEPFLRRHIIHDAVLQSTCCNVFAKFFEKMFN